MVGKDRGTERQWDGPFIGEVQRINADFPPDIPARGGRPQRPPRQAPRPNWLRLDERRFASRAHFFAAAAEAMRRILIDRARRRLAARHGGGQEHVDVDEIEIAAPTEKDDELLAVHEALDRLAAHDARKAELVNLHYFAGLPLAEAAEVLGISPATAHRDWTYARAWLHQDIDAK